MSDHSVAATGGPDAAAGGPTPTGLTTSRSWWVRLVVFVVLVLVAVVVAAFVDLPGRERLAADVRDLGPAAPMVFVLGYAALTLVPLPKNVLTVVAGLLFGLVQGVALALLGALLGALVAFALGRALGREAVERLTGRRVARVDDLLSRHGLLAVLGVRLVPVLPFTAINYAAGLTAVRTRDYLIGTALGMVPGTIAYASLGAYGSSPGSWPFAVAVVALVVLSVGGGAAAHRFRRSSQPVGRDGHP